MNPELQSLFTFMAPAVLFFGVLYLVRGWRLRQPSSDVARYRVLGMCRWLFAVSVIGVAVTSDLQARHWAGIALILLSFGMAERERAQLKRKIQDA